MFHVKLCKTNDIGNDVQTNISCKSYHVTHFRPKSSSGRESAMVTVENGSKFEINPENEDRGYEVCFVTNESGKTIDRIGPFDKEAA